MTALSVQEVRAPVNSLSAAAAVFLSRPMTDEVAAGEAHVHLFV